MAVLRNTRGVRNSTKGNSHSHSFPSMLVPMGHGGYIWGGYEYRYVDEYNYGDDCLIAHIRQMICYCFY